MELRQLEYFYTVSKLKSFTKASEVLCVSQPSITISIKKLEEELGLNLLERSNRKINLTECGEIFYGRIENLLDNLNNIILEMNDLKLNQKETINIGIVPMAGEYIYKKIFMNYKNHNTIKINIINAGSQEIIKLIEEDVLDMGIIILSNIPSNLDVIEIKQNETVVCISKEHKFKDMETIPFEILKDEDFILPSEGTYTRKIILKECEKNNIDPNIILTSTQIETSKSLVSENIGITFLEKDIAKKNLDILCKSLQNPIYKQSGLVWKSGKYLSKNKKELINFISSI